MTQMVGASDMDSCIGSNIGNLECELAIKVGGGNSKGRGVLGFDWASWKSVLPDSPPVLLCPETSLNPCGYPRSLELELVVTSGPGRGVVRWDCSGALCLECQFNHPSRPSRLRVPVVREGTS